MLDGITLRLDTEEEYRAALRQLTEWMKDEESQTPPHVESLIQGESVNPTDWQASIGGENKPSGVDYYDEANMVPATLQTIDANKIWNIISITVNEL